jgi:putative hydrolase of the HAD superfamily
MAAEGDIRVLFFDVGGVLLTNGWDRGARREACRTFDLDWDDFQDRHEHVVDSFERGTMPLETYVERTVFYRERPFGEREFTDHMYRCSQPKQESLDLLTGLSASGRYLLATLNNESRELNDYRIERFGLREHFPLFLSSCYLGVRKPEPEIYQTAVDLVQQEPSRCVFVDDRELNLECAVLAGIQTIHFESAEGLRAALSDLGVQW